MSFIKAATSWLEPLITALTVPGIPWAYRWRLLPFQAIALLTYAQAYLTAPTSSVICIPTRRKHTLRALVFIPPTKADTDPGANPRPLHIDFHGGVFLGGIAEYDAKFCSQLSTRTGAVVVSVEYRHAPRHAYPAAHEDAADATSWILANGEKFWNANPEELTVSGFSAGANLMVVAGKRAKAAVGLYAPVDLRTPPWEKPKPANMPNDPLAWLEPLYDSYAASCADRQHDEQLSPILRSADDLPRNILLIVPAIDILLYEQLSFIERLKKDKDQNHQEPGRVFEAMTFDQGFHGWLEVPSSIIDNTKDREIAFQKAADFITAVHSQQ